VFEFKNRPSSMITRYLLSVTVVCSQRQCKWTACTVTKYKYRKIGQNRGNMKSMCMYLLN